MILHRVISDIADKLGHIFLIGPKGSGKRTTASEIQERLQQQAIELSIQNEICSLPSIICLEQNPIRFEIKISCLRCRSGDCLK